MKTEVFHLDQADEKAKQLQLTVPWPVPGGLQEIFTRNGTLDGLGLLN